MRKIKKGYLCALLGILLSGGVIGGSVLQKGIFADRLNAAHLTYSITLNTEDKIKTGEASSFVRNTAKGNPITFTATQLNVRSETQWFAQLASVTGSHLENSSPLNGIEKITIKSQFKANGGGYKLSGGASSSDLNVEYTHTSTYVESGIVTTAFEFGGEINYFKLANTSNSCGTYINEITIEYSCVAADGTRDAKEKASGDLLYKSYLNAGCGFDYPGFTANMRSSTVATEDSGYSANFHCNPNVTVSKQKAELHINENYPVAQIELAEAIDMRGYGFEFDIKFVNAHNWFIISLLDSNGEYILKHEGSGIGVDVTLDSDHPENFAKAYVLSEKINDAKNLEKDRTSEDLADVKYIEFLFNFDSGRDVSKACDVYIDNIKLNRGVKYQDDGNRTLYYEKLSKQYSLSETLIIDIKFDNPTVHSEVGINLYEESWGNYFGKYWIDKDSTHNGIAYYEDSYSGLKVVALSDGYFRIYANLSKLNEGSTQPTSYVEYLFLSAPNTEENRGTGWVDIEPIGRVHAPLEIYATNTAFAKEENCTIDFPTTFERGDGIVIAELALNDAINKVAVMVGNWDEYNGYYNIYATSTGQIDTGVTGVSLGNNKVRVSFDLATTVKSYTTVSAGYQFFYIRGNWSNVGGTVSVYFQRT